MDTKSSEREKQICERLRQFRASLQIPRTRFALSIGLTEAALAGYELGRARVRYDTFAAVQKRFFINPVWLATGQENMLLYNWSDESFRAQLKPRELFSQAYQRLVARQVLGERLNKDGTLANAKLAKDWFACLPRFLQALAAAGLTLAELAKSLERKNFSLGTAKDLKAIQNGKKYPGGVAVAILVDELRINEIWLWTGKGGMFRPAQPPPGGPIDDTASGRARLRGLVARVREQIGTASASLDLLEQALTEYDQELTTAAHAASTMAAMKKAAAGDASREHAAGAEKE
jgi:transcriptional regulator with XRE-family HTH domain